MPPQKNNKQLINKLKIIGPLVAATPMYTISSNQNHLVQSLSISITEEENKMAQSKQATKADVKNTAKEEHPVTDKLQDTLHDSVDTLAEKVSAAEESLRETAHNSSETLTKKQSEIENKWNKSAVKKYATENPVAAAGIAFTVGMLVSSLLKRK